jgi:alginate O-acetyltransferase complex protein AlgI
VPDDKPYRRYALWLGLAYDFAVLVWFKYRLAFAPGAPLPFAALSPAIPVGISFYTFQQAVLLIDAYNRDASVVAFFGRLGSLREKARGFLNHAFFVSFFAHVLIGPIVYLEEFQPQIASRTFGRLRRRDLEVGLTLIAIGLFKKFIMADRLARIADPVFAAAAAGHGVHGNLTTAAALAGTAAFYMQLYFDFSGYTDMALGLARLFGIRFPMNFYSPLKAVGIMDYYRRWHMTLTRAIARFFYTPLALAGTRFAARRKIKGLPARMAGQWLPLLINFQAIALWHGARLTFVLFGLFHGVWYVCETEMSRLPAYRRWRERSSERTRLSVGRGLTARGTAG